MKYLIFSLLIALSGCGATIPNSALERAKLLCADNGGIKQLSIYNRRILVCVNGASFEYLVWKS